MKKGDFHISTILALIIAAIILLIFSPMLIKVSAEVWNSLMLSLGIIKPSNIEQAVLCSYYRCVQGCASIKMDEIKWTTGYEEIGFKKVKETINCNYFCQFPDEWNCTNHQENCYSDVEFSLLENKWISKDLKVCGEKSEKFPVKITLIADEKIEKSHLKLPMATDVTCIIPSGSKGIDVASDIIEGLLSPLTSLWNIIVSIEQAKWELWTGPFEDNWLIVNSTLIKSRGSESRCTASYNLPITDNSVEELVIKGDRTISVKTDYFNFFDKVKFLVTQVV